MPWSISCGVDTPGDCREIFIQNSRQLGRATLWRCEPPSSSRSGQPGQKSEQLALMIGVLAARGERADSLQFPFSSTLTSLT